MTGRKLLGYISPHWREPATCEACGHAFICGAAVSGCWCAEIKLSEAVRADLRARYQQCLCRDCLERYAVSEAKEKSG